MAVATPEPKTANNETSNQQGRLHDPYLWHRLHSASGIFPIGFFLLQHLIANSYALRGAGAYNTVIKVYGGLPFVAVLEIALIYVPILYHSIYGIWITAYGQANLGKYQYGRNWMYFLQRVSGVIAFFYIGYHVWNTSLQKYILLWQHNPDPEARSAIGRWPRRWPTRCTLRSRPSASSRRCSTSRTACGTSASAGASRSRPTPSA